MSFYALCLTASSGLWPVTYGFLRLVPYGLWLLMPCALRLMASYALCLTAYGFLCLVPSYLMPYALVLLCSFASCLIVYALPRFTNHDSLSTNSCLVAYGLFWLMSCGLWPILAYGFCLLIPYPVFLISCPNHPPHSPKTQQKTACLSDLYRRDTLHTFIFAF